jgi:hypothetical protein
MWCVRGDAVVTRIHQHLEDLAKAMREGQVGTYGCMYVRRPCMYVCMYVSSTRTPPDDAEAALTPILPPSVCVCVPGACGQVRHHQGSEQGAKRVPRRQVTAPPAGLCVCVLLCVCVCVCVCPRALPLSQLTPAFTPYSTLTSGSSCMCACVRAYVRACVPPHRWPWA